MKKVIIFLAVVIAAGFLFFTQSSQKKNLVIMVTDNGWDSQKFHNAVAKLIVDHAFDGYELQYSTASSTMNWQSMTTGDVDLDIESWTGNVVTYPQDKAEGKIVDVGILVPDSAQGLYVPRYVIEGDLAAGIEPLAPELVSVKDLKKYAQVFSDEESTGKGRIYGSIPGWMSDEILYKKYELYGLSENFNYVRLGSEATIFSSLVSAYNLHRPWVGFCYEPTWVVGKLDLVRLQDDPYDEAGFQEGRTEFPRQELKIVSSSAFAKKAPDLLSFFAKYKTGSKVVSEALSYLDENRASHDEAAVWFLKNNDHLLDAWLPAENAQKLRKYLATL